MAFLIRPLRKTLSSPCLKTLSILHQHQKPTPFFTYRNYIMIFPKEIQYELDGCSSKTPTINSFVVDYQAAQQEWLRLKRKFGDKEDITVEMSDLFTPVSNSGKAEDDEDDDVQLPLRFTVNISKGGDSDVLKIMCSACPDGIKIKKLFVCGHDKIPNRPYFGPGFKELDDELQDSLCEFLKEGGINDRLAAFLHGIKEVAIQYRQLKEKFCS